MKIRIYLVVLAGVMLCGCSATQDRTRLTQLQLRVGDLERQLEMREAQLKDLKYEMKDLSYEMDRLKVPRVKAESSRAVLKPKRVKNSVAITSTKKQGTIRVPVSVRKIQKALKGAGYYDGPVDGKIGKKTKRAISAFQKDNGLKGDGVVGRRTWAELKVYLD